MHSWVSPSGIEFLKLSINNVLFIVHTKYYHYQPNTERLNMNPRIYQLIFDIQDLVLVQPLVCRKYMQYFER